MLEGITHAPDCECYICDAEKTVRRFGSKSPEWLREEEIEYYQATEGMTNEEIEIWLEKEAKC